MLINCEGEHQRRKLLRKKHQAPLVLKASAPWELGWGGCARKHTKLSSKNAKFRTSSGQWSGKKN